MKFVFNYLVDMEESNHKIRINRDDDGQMNADCKSVYVYTVFI